MESANSIRYELMQYMKIKKFKYSQFSEIAGINSGTLSRILQGNKSISMNQLVAITAGMRLPEDYFFEDYIEECFSLVISIRRIRPFIIRCAELDRLDCVEQIVNRLLDDLAYVSVLFEIAEELYENNKRFAARVLYRSVSETEKYQHSERLALCQYRLFLIDLGENLEGNVRAATQFELYVYRLDEANQIEALKQLMHVFGMGHKWAKVDALAKEMHRIATIRYDLQCGSGRLVESQKRTEQPLYYYILYANLARSTASEECGDYERALEFVSKYAAGESWIQEKDEEARHIIKQFSEWAVANTFLYRLMSGEVGVLHEYVNYIASHEDEIFIAVRHMVQAANLYKLNIDNILERFASYIPYQSNKTEFGQYKQAILKESYAQFLSDLAVYRLDQRDTILSITGSLVHN
ncbi:helix-turn-helix domain-containing protein [Paenibacillus xylanilyticus]|uniref:Helix-turn-helix transcriptional regulator n=1 Tax=Paenibacillus xylanilyticus TaxID=248903 RepID=A0A7Y6BUN1_9BACL|nr:helix-turn-helix transcriptional regulator [Paenibacillus xylanilyticus]NUU75315.1 helix-turn-helix transcriptional regulator [Paenibacillus xylanilyticus]